MKHKTWGHVIYLRLHRVLCALCCHPTFTDQWGGQECGCGKISHD
jgi:hypothetical protein